MPPSLGAALVPLPLMAPVPPAVVPLAPALAPVVPLPPAPVLLPEPATVVPLAAVEPLAPVLAAVVPLPLDGLPDVVAAALPVVPEPTEVVPEVGVAADPELELPEVVEPVEGCPLWLWPWFEGGLEELPHALVKRTTTIHDKCLVKCISVPRQSPPRSKSMRTVCETRSHWRFVNCECSIL